MRRDRLEQRVFTYINNEEMVAPGQRVLLAVSGGADSMALLSIFATLAPQLGIRLAVAHLDHGLRPTSWREAELVERYCHELKIPFYLRSMDVGIYCQEHHLGIEAGAREVRHRWLREVAAMAKAERIATAHHRDDQAETILLHLLRGSGIKGLGGMAPSSDLYLRPLLHCSKDELVAYLDAKAIDYIEDESNQDPAYLRNRIRHQLLPLLEADYNSAIRERLLTLGEVAREDYSYLEMAARQAMSKIVEQVHPDTWCLELTGWRQEHPALQRMILLQLLALVRGEEDFTKSDVDALVKLAHSHGSSKQVRLARAVLAQLEYGKLYLQRDTVATSGGGFTYDLAVPGKVIVRERNLVIEVTSEPPANGNHQVIALNAQTCPSSIKVRTRRAGDRIQLPGGTKKLSDWFIDHKVPSPQRDQHLLLASDDQLIWIENGPLSVLYRADLAVEKIWLVLNYSS